jgi:hypothetical protein
VRKGREGKGREGVGGVASSLAISNKFGGVQNYMRSLYPSDNKDLNPW